MYTAIKGIYENGQVIFEEPPPTLQKSKVVIMFLSDEEPTQPAPSGVKLGSLAGQGYAIPEDFNDPLDDFAEYQ